MRLATVKNVIWRDVATTYNSIDNKIYVLHTNKGFNIGMYVCGKQFPLFTYEGVYDEDTVINNLVYEANTHLYFTLEYKNMFKLSYCGLKDDGERRGLLYHYNTVFIDDYTRHKRYEIYFEYGTYDGNPVKDVTTVQKLNAVTGTIDLEHFYIGTTM